MALGAFFSLDLSLRTGSEPGGTGREEEGGKWEGSGGGESGGRREGTRGEVRSWERESEREEDAEKRGRTGVTDPEEERTRAKRKRGGELYMTGKIFGWEWRGSTPADGHPPGSVRPRRKKPGGGLGRSVCSRPRGRVPTLLFENLTPRTPPVRSPHPPGLRVLGTQNSRTGPRPTDERDYLEPRPILRPFSPV